MPRAKSSHSHRRHALAPVAAAAVAKHTPEAATTEATVVSEPSTSTPSSSTKPKPLASITPYSKSHAKREKRKLQQIAGGLGSISAALEAVVAVEPTPKAKGKTTPSSKAGDDGKIGEGRSHGLREKQRRKLLTANAARIPAVMAHPAFKANPWATIREHAGNSLAVAPEVEAVAERKRLAEAQKAKREIVRLRGSDGSGMEVE